jgi:hypothetical protein
MIKSELGRFCLHRLAKDRNQTIQFGRFLANPR